MSGRRRPGLSPSLFPFLAVLVCTLGTLILLLALVAQNATDAAEQQKVNRAASVDRQAQNPSTLSSEVADRMIEEEQFRVQQLVSFRDAQTQEIGGRKDQLTHLENHIARIKKDLKRLSDEVEMATGTKPVSRVDEEMLADLRRRIDEESKAIDQLREEKGNAAPKVVIVPHKGPNGTRRRPIYLECDSEGLTIQPEGTVITVAQLRDSRTSANPLDAALRTIRHHAMHQYGDKDAPYPMLVVRPDGIDTYRAARMAMHDWDDQFGYEMVPEEIELTFDQPDARLRELIEVVVRESVQQQRAAHAIVTRGSGGAGFGRGDRLGATRTGRRFPTLSAKALGREGRASGFRSVDDSRFASMNSGRSVSYGENTPGESAASRQMDEQFRSAAQQLGSDNDGFAQGSSIAADAASAISEYNNSLGEDDHVGPYQSTSSAEEKLDNESNQQRRAGNSDVASQTPRAGDSRSRGTSRPGSASVSATASPSPRSEQPSAGPPKSLTVSNAVTQELVKRQGADWALPRSVARSHGNAIVRTIRMQCYSDRLVLLPSKQDAATEIFGVGDGDVVRATMQLATSIRDRIDRWGAALPGGRWQPRLEVEVMPGGESRFHQLRTLMAGSGVDVQGRATP